MAAAPGAWTGRAAPRPGHLPGTGETGPCLAWTPLPAPAELVEEMPLPARMAAAVEAARAAIRAVLMGTGDRLLVVAGPCAVHDPAAAVDYARRLVALQHQYAGDLLIVMRVYFEKPRTVGGWKGLVNDPDMDGGHDLARGLRLTRQLLMDVADTGLPAGCEWLDPMMPGYLADAVSWGAIGARTAESQVHRQLASGLPMPVGFKNGTDGDVQVAVDGCRAAAAGHAFFGFTPGGGTAKLISAGNPDCHVILRGGRHGPNYRRRDVAAALDLVTATGLPRRVMVDASHGNSGKDHRRQPGVAADIAAQIAAGEPGLAGVMLESFLIEGRQEPGDPARLAYGKSVVDACIDIGTTAEILGQLAAAVRERRDVLRATRSPARPGIPRQAGPGAVTPAGPPPDHGHSAGTRPGARVPAARI